MSVRFYEFGQLSGGSEESGNVAPPAEASYGAPQPFVGTVGAAGTTLPFAGSTKQVTVRNTHETASMEYSLDAGTIWFGLGSYGGITEEVSIGFLMLRRVDGEVTYEVNAILAG